MRKILLIVLCLLMCGAIYYIYESYSSVEVEKKIELDGIAYIEKYYVYGTNFNLIGYLDNNDNIKDIKLILYNDKRETELNLDYELVEDRIVFSTSNLINVGYYLDKTELGKNYLLLKISMADESMHYYGLENKSDYKELKYYTLSKINHVIFINSDNQYNTLMLDVKKNKDDNVYDITIDPGHGGKDPGACSKGNCEKGITLDLAMMLVNKLNEAGLKVNLTRTDNDTGIPNYNMNGMLGRAVIPNESNSKYMFSIHLNSHVNKKMHGVEILTPTNIDYSFAKMFADKIVEYTGTSYSINMGNKMFDGVYTRTFNAKDIKEHMEEYKELAYDVKEGTSYYFMIRETGGILTGAYIDSRNPSIGENPYYNSNKGIESYILELGYIISSDDINNILNNKENYVNAIYDSIMEKLNSYEK
ncbi:MAG: N-acetylmuramoyl-L-alanine amidase [Tenericutes bacterium]|nr:N-acetylmuramoyl-L-alanine amidase [Mycoplasmatota bacterium]